MVTRVVLLWMRSIPACTGEPAIVGPFNGQGAVYPRVYGGTGFRLAVRIVRSGLSPRVRGNQHKRDATVLGLRSIPACTGEPSPRLGLFGLLWVYPRVYGGTSGGPGGGGGLEGLSPRVRGNRTRAVHFVSLRGSIPACTGNEDSRGQRGLRDGIPACTGEPRV